MALRLAALVFLLGSLGSHVALAQGSDNSCTYSYASGKGDAYISFCLTKYGTLALLQSPAGVNHLDPANPVEGFAICDITGFTPVNEYVVPAMGVGELPTVLQPKGPGKLPITFNYHYVSSTVTSVPADKTVVFTMKVGKFWGEDKYQFAAGPWVRGAGLLVDGSSSVNFANSGFSAFAYNAVGHGVMVTGNFTGSVNGVGGGVTTTNGIGGVNSVGISRCGQTYQGPFVGRGFIFNSTDFSTAGPGTATFSYKAF